MCISPTGNERDYKTISAQSQGHCFPLWRCGREKAWLRARLQSFGKCMGVPTHALPPLSKAGLSWVHSPVKANTTGEERLCAREPKNDQTMMSPTQTHSFFFIIAHCIDKKIAIISTALNYGCQDCELCDGNNQSTSHCICLHRLLSLTLLRIKTNAIMFSYIQLISWVVWSTVSFCHIDERIWGKSMENRSSLFIWEARLMKTPLSIFFPFSFSFFFVSYCAHIRLSQQYNNKTHCLLFCTTWSITTPRGCKSVIWMTQH